MRAQIWFLSSWFALLQHARPRTLLPFGFIPSSSTHHYGEWSVTHECPAVMPTVLQTATAQVDPWRLLAVDGGSGTSRGHAPVMRRPSSRRSGAVTRPSVFQAGHIPSWHKSCESYALSAVAGACRWLLLLLSPLLSARSGRLCPAAPWSSPGDRRQRGGDGPVSWPGSLPLGVPGSAACFRSSGRVRGHPGHLLDAYAPRALSLPKFYEVRTDDGHLICAAYV